MSRRVGILAIQGDVEAHTSALARIGAAAVPVLREKHLADLDALILPGGESTTIAKGIDRLGLREPLRGFAESGRMLLGTCAGAILLSRESRQHPVPTLDLMDSQLGDLRCVFIRAPRLVEPGPDVEVLVRVDGEPVLLRQGNCLACTFHPELTLDGRVHDLLL